MNNGHDGRSGMHIDFLPLLRRRWAHVALMAIAISDVLSARVIPAETDTHHTVLWFVLAFIDMFSLCMAVVIVLTAIEVCMPAARWRLAVMVTAVVAVPAGMTSLWSFRNTLYVTWEVVAFGVLLALVYEWQAKTDMVIEAVRASRIARARAEQKILESRLSSLKARVDPQLLFAVMARANTLYGMKISAGEKLLEQLIDFLRASLQQSQAMTVTLDQEVLLCRLYLDLEKVTRDDALSYETRIDPAVAGHYFPPAVLLPLLQAALAATAAAARQRHLSIRADREPACVRIEITCHAAAPPPPREALDAASAALRRFFGDVASVVATRAPFGGGLIRIEVPHVST
jgi:sensor histidine kinase YesM